MKGVSKLLRWSKASAVDVFKDYFDDWHLYMPGISTGPTVWGAPPEAPGTGLAATVYATRASISEWQATKGKRFTSRRHTKSYLSNGGQVRLKVLLKSSKLKTKE